MKLFTPDQLDTLRASYANISTIDPATPSYKTLIQKMDKYPPEVLKQLAGAKIKFVSGLAGNRVKKLTTTEGLTEEMSPSKVHAQIIANIYREIQSMPHLADERSYKKAAKDLLIARPVIPAAQVESMTGWFMRVHPYSEYKSGAMNEGVTDYSGRNTGRNRSAILGELSAATTDQQRSALSAEARRAGAGQSEMQAAIMKSRAQQESTRLITKQTTGNKTAKIYKDSDTGEFIVKFYVDGVYQKDADYFTDDREDALGTAKSEIKRWRPATDTAVTEADVEGVDNPRDIEKEQPPEPKLDWVSKFDLGEIKEAMQKIVDHLAETDDPEQTDLLRNDIRILDNLHDALNKADGTLVCKTWKIAKSEGSCEHLHDEFCRRMDDACATASVRESYVAEADETSTFSNKAKWLQAAKKYRIKATDTTATAICKDTGKMVGRWSKNKGWLETA